jgi:hypothetical protein
MTGNGLPSQASARPSFEDVRSVAYDRDEASCVVGLLRFWILSDRLSWTGGSTWHLLMRLSEQVREPFNVSFLTHVILKIQNLRRLLSIPGTGGLFQQPPHPSPSIS